MLTTTIKTTTDLLRTDKRGRVRFGFSVDGEGYRAEVVAGKVTFYNRYTLMGVEKETKVALDTPTFAGIQVLQFLATNTGCAMLNRAFEIS